MFDAGALLNQFLGADTGETLQKGKEYLSKNAGSLAGGAAVAGLAYKAFTNYQQQKQGIHSAPILQPEPVP